MQGTGRQIEFSKDTPGDYPVSLQYYTDCGWSNETFRIIRVEDRLSFNIYPNPTTDLLTVELISNDSKNNIFSRSSAVDMQPYTIKLWNEYLGYVRTFEVTESVNQISLQGLPNGMYIVLIVQDGKTLQRKIVWKN